MSLLDMLRREDVWNSFYQEKLARNQLSRKEAQQLEQFLQEKRYLLFSKGQDENNHTPYQLGIPVRKTISKMGTSKKRVVYTFSEDETWCLKLLAHLLYCYDDRLSDSCYSFRKRMTAGTAFKRIRRIPNLDEKYVLKADIHDYFNSIPVESLIQVLQEIITEDNDLFSFLCSLLRKKDCLSNGERIREDMGAMAGVPLASFFANFYLLSLDREFEAMEIPYFRYSDDILIFADSETEIQNCYDLLLERIREKGLTINENKLVLYRPHEGFEFLGFFYQNGTVDISNAAVQKMHDKIRRKARSLYRKRGEKGYSFEKAAAILIRSFDDRLYDMTGNNEFTWTRFYFPVITATAGLRKIDACLLQYLRYLYSGRHYKGNYAVSYDQLKALGYTSLVHEYYTWKRDCARLAKS